MKDQINETELEAGERQDQPKRERKRQSSAPMNGDVEGVVRIKVPPAVGIRAKDVVAELRARGAQVTLDELLSEYVEAIPDRYFEAQLLQRTPEPYYLEAATRVPELREMLIRQAKKGLMRASAQDLLPREARRPRRKAGSVEVNTSQDSAVSGAGE